ncbi:anti-sigma factor domain-containing protein [Kribbella sp. NBC_00889]|uniref:anti-sigma factor n=1 Tax=Kribbella sp. NBC_00889 TaxID=2975974 RepID=UPI003865E6E0|nr:anti-sigma factor [Kribbella sp. NBC_00889]
MTESDVHTLTGPYVLDALPEDERTLFEAHLAGCTFCATEVAELREAAVKLATQVAAPPPPSLKPNVLAAIDHVRQVPPVVAGHRGVPARKRFTRRSVLTLAAAALAVAGVGGVAVDQYREKTDAVQANDQIAAVLSQPDARTVRGPVAGGGHATIVMSPSADEAVVVLNDLPRLRAGRTWQLWMIDPSKTAHSVGLAAGDTTRVLDGSVTGMIAFGLTNEPTGGSATPSQPAAATIPMT